MAKVKTISGENWGVCGKMNTGKTHITLKVAREISLRTSKPILIYDPTNNRSYADIESIVTTDDLAEYALEEYQEYKVVGDYEMDEFLRVATLYIRNTIIVLDDCGNEFVGNLNATQMAFVTASKNNGNDVFYQFHNFGHIAPKLCHSLQMLILKEQASAEIPKKVVNYQRVQILHDHVVAENNKRDPEEIWSYRIYDIYRDRVFKEDKQGKLQMIDGRTYFLKNK